MELDLPTIRFLIWIIFITVETITLSLDFLAMGLAWIATSIILFIIGPTRHTRIISVIIFLIFASIALILTRKYLKPWREKNRGSEPMAADQIIGHQSPVYFLNEKLVIKYQGSYRLINNPHGIKKGDHAEVTSIKNNSVTIKKIHKE